MSEFYHIVNYIISVVAVLFVGSTLGFMFGNLLWTIYSTATEFKRLFPEEMRRRGYWK